MKKYSKKYSKRPTSGCDLIAQERRRQIVDEGWSPSHDDRHRAKDLAKAAESYLACWAHPDQDAKERGAQPEPCWNWPWARKWWKPSDDPVRNLVKAGALIAAEIDRIRRSQTR